MLFLTCIQLSVGQNPQVPFCGAALQPLVPQSVQIARVAPSQVHNLALVLVELHVVDDCPALICQDLFVRSTFDGASSSSQFSVIHKLA